MQLQVPKPEQKYLDRAKVTLLTICIVLYVLRIGSE